ncbi:membrane permease [Salmonella enterica subsp. enterica serovar Pullorum]|nr:membrane permease [Salmonella enterica subsp. enterica serovar Pullorum]
MNGAPASARKGRFTPASRSSVRSPISQALAGFFPGWMLTQIGYIPNVVQSAGTVEGLRQLIFIYPCVLAVITIIAMGCFYNLNEKMYVRIVEEIEARKHTV